MRMSGRFPKYGGAKLLTWKKYSIQYDKDESTAYDGSSSSMSSSTTKMAADSYTVSSDGVFTLVSPTSTQVTNLTGKWIVDISTSSSSATTGSTLYYVRSISGWTSKTINYTRYTGAVISGYTYLEDVQAAPGTYPVLGIQSGYRWVLRNCTYNRYAISYTITLHSSGTTSIAPGNRMRLHSTYSQSIINNEPKFVCDGPHTTVMSGDPIGSYKYESGDGTAPSYRPALVESTTGTYLYEYLSISGSNVTYKTFAWNPKGNYVDSITADADAYPHDGISGDYWYTLQT